MALLHLPRLLRRLSPQPFHAASAAAACRARSLSAMAPKLRLTYLDMKGFGEPIRLALAIGGLDFEDRRVSSEEIIAMRQRGELAFGQVPVLEIDGEAFLQSQALLRWAGRQAGLYPEELQLRCDAVEEALVDIRRGFIPQWYGVILGRDPITSEKLVPLSEEQKQEVQQKLNESVLPARFSYLEKQLKAAGGPYFCGERLTICDLSFYVLASGVLDGTYVDGVTPSVLDGCPLLKELIGRIAHHPRVKAWNDRAAQGSA
eukprot:CAMPEP_0177327642 /NCGR_PEP_ID=MMETSP0368-20130122/19004_1 /TAXON_ID=447022 ORGANISM="Scrippsiella hangoei-like, Strain SHHI-4" /NCGR_SAMPLE_ID=MMETSP0368 /ASSEMBLY_ACC=CAM_ASM_000363 /LENGTH=259 /DNA_ID=CAMNT_0018787727 /DNA_START=6 /DNA_END=785 /DNA_ORIENTATION=-